MAIKLANRYLSVVRVGYTRTREYKCIMHNIRHWLLHIIELYFSFFTLDSDE